MESNPLVLVAPRLVSLASIGVFPRKTEQEAKFELDLIRVERKSYRSLTRRQKERDRCKIQLSSLSLRGPARLLVD